LSAGHLEISYLRRLVPLLVGLFASAPGAALAATEHKGGGEASLILPDLGSVQVMGMSGRSLLLLGMLVAVAGMAFGIVALFQVKKLPAHRSMTDISDLIWETCKTYLFTRANFYSRSRY
jgi:K(+)-stimulated pyrophosphate-energized sodium pump